MGLGFPPFFVLLLIYLVLGYLYLLDCAKSLIDLLLGLVARSHVHSRLDDGCPFVFFFVLANELTGWRRRIGIASTYTHTLYGSINYVQV